MGAAELPHRGDEERQHDPVDKIKGSDRRCAIYFHARQIWSRRSARSTETRSASRATEASSSRRTKTFPPSSAHCIARALTYHLSKRPAKPG